MYTFFQVAVVSVDRLQCNTVPERHQTASLLTIDSLGQFCSRIPCAKEKKKTLMFRKGCRKCTYSCLYTYARMTSGLCAREWEKGARSKGSKRLQGLRGVQSFPRSDVTNDAPIANDPDVVWCVCACRDKVYGACVSL